MFCVFVCACLLSDCVCKCLCVYICVCVGVYFVVYVFVSLRVFLFFFVLCVFMCGVVCVFLWLDLVVSGCVFNVRLRVFAVSLLCFVEAPPVELHGLLLQFKMQNRL